LIVKCFCYPAVRARAAILMRLQAKGKMPSEYAHPGY
jgi:hypothetical protein